MPAVFPNVTFKLNDAAGEEILVLLVYVNHNIQQAILLRYNTLMSEQTCEKRSLTQAHFEAPQKMVGAKIYRNNNIKVQNEIVSTLQHVKTVKNVLIGID